MAAGLAQCVVLVPSDVVKVNMQADDVDINGKRKYSGSLNCMFHILKTENIRGLYKGSIRIIHHLYSFSYSLTRRGCGHRVAGNTVDWNILRILQFDQRRVAESIQF